MSHLSTDILVVGAGGAGMYAAIAAARGGARVVLADKSLIGRGGATVMAQMTVAVALGEQEPDHWTHHLADTLDAGRNLCNEELAAILCREAPERIREMDQWKVGWARADGHLTQAMAPGHKIRRCVYVDFLNTGPAVAKTLRSQVARHDAIVRVGGLSITDLVRDDGRVVGAVGIDMETGRSVTIAAKAVILAAGGLTRLYRRNSASANMGGAAFALALTAGAELIDMEFVQFFPIGHLAPRLVGMDPIMWDPFRYKLGGRLLNGRHEEFIHNYGASDSGTYTVSRDVASFAILSEVAAGRGSPAGGAYLSFEHIAEADLRAAFGPVIDRLLANGIDLTKRAIEVSPIAHYHMGGIRVNGEMATNVAGLYAAGEAVGGANGANRLSGNAISEAFVFGERAGRFTAAWAAGQTMRWDDDLARAGVAAIRAVEEGEVSAQTAGIGPIFGELQEMMWDKVGLLRDQAGLKSALARLRQMRELDLPALAPGRRDPFALAVQDWFDLRAGLIAAEAITLSALARQESRGAHQRDDFPASDPAWEVNQVVRLVNGVPTVERRAVVRGSFELAPLAAAQ
ncbi:MAG: FAD-binding protein [Alphaproteobacteria bacterium]|nr:FAD-binding protein [Alphaproteobacteria bacterium]MDP6812146.1 FAD-binding protein [Alphaproteobacteria bacterium]